MARHIAILFALLASAAFAQDADSTWKALLSISGDWTGEGSGKPGEGTGEFSLRPELDGAILVRHNKSDYPAADGKPSDQSSRPDDRLPAQRASPRGLLG